MQGKIISLYRERLAREKGAVLKDWGGRVTIALAYPNYYHIGMSNLGFQIVYHLFNENENIVAERVFFPEGQEMSLYLQTGKGILSLESCSPLYKFDIVAFSLSFENDYPNILKILDLGKVPLLSEDRDESHPFIMAGGIATFLNPEPMAPFFDFFQLGEAEANLNAFIEVFSDLRNARIRRHEVLKNLAHNIKSIYVPSLYHVEYSGNGIIKSMEPIGSHIPEKIEVVSQVPLQSRVNTSVILTNETEFSGRTLIELGRGCGRSCRFCAAGYVYRPPRIHEESDLLACVDHVMKNNRRIGLLSASVSDTPGIERISGIIVDKGGTFSISSLRADSLTEELLDNLKRSGQNTVAIAPEAGSERLRKVVNKHLTREQILSAAQLIARTKDFTLRLYFLIGLPTETNEDVADILQIIKAIKHQVIKESSTRGRIGRIKLSINCFVPKPFTPFQWFPMEYISTLKTKQKWLKKALVREGGVNVNFDVPKWAYVQTLLSMGDRRVGSILLLAHELHNDWTRAFRSSQINPDFFVHRPKGHDEILPWDFINHGINKEYLLNEYTLALKGRESDICHVGKCHRCGVCQSTRPFNSF